MVQLSDGWEAKIMQIIERVERKRGIRSKGNGRKSTSRDDIIVVGVMIEGVEPILRILVRSIREIIIRGKAVIIN